MKDLKEVEFTKKHSESLARIARSKDFSVLEDISNIIIYNLMVKMMKNGTRDPVERTLDSEYVRGQAYMLKRFIRLIKDSTKKDEDE